MIYKGQGKPEKNNFFTQKHLIMTFLTCTCPLAEAIEDIDPLVCGENFGQIQKLVIGRRNTTPRFPTFTGAVALGADLLGSWNTYKIATDATKLQTTPFITNLAIPAVEAIREGADSNATIDGIPEVIGETTPLVPGEIRGLPATIRRQLKSLSCYNDLVAFFINEVGRIIGATPDDVQFQAIPIFALHVGDPINDGKNTVDRTPFTFALRAGWADNLAFCDPSDFDARNDL